ncbi:MAG: arginine--tRNA ligase [Candidatus Thermoplasmatota archaeon]|nr:arginine--tRNA ligase [Candidatus Thermoplasmatota archaeon]
MNSALEILELELKSILTKALTNLKLAKPEILEFSTPPPNLGDYAFPCFELAKEKPERIAEMLSKESLKYKSKFIDKVEAVGAYVNFFINYDKLKELVIKSALELKERYGWQAPKHDKIILEHTSANPTGPIHVGRARNSIIGDTLARVLRANGYEVETQYYVNDMGKQVGILVWGLDNIKLEKTEPKAMPKSDHELVKYYQEASKLLEAMPQLESEIDKLLQLYEGNDIKTKAKVRSCCEKVLHGNIETLAKLNIKLDKYVWESDFIGTTREVLSNFRSSKLCREEEGAYYLDLSSGKLFITRKDSTTLYATRDLAYHLYKFKNCTHAINVLGEDHKLEALQLEEALKVLGCSNKPEVIFYSFVSLPEGRLSTRKGRVVYTDDLIEEAIARAYLEVKERRKKFDKHEFKKISEADLKKIAAIIGIGAIRYNIIRVQNEKPIIFKWEEAISFEGNSAPFVQYSHARACSILSKSKGYYKNKIELSLLKERQELELVKILARFPKVIKDVGSSRKVYKLANYVFELATQFNQFYRDVPVLKAEPKELRDARLALVDATRIVLRNALELLGIEAPEEM